MEDLRKRQEVFLSKWHNICIERINNRFEKNKGFILKELLDDDKRSNPDIIYSTKGILLNLLAFNYISIFAIYGNGNYVYKINKKIDTNIFK